MPSDSLQFIVDELFPSEDSAIQAAKHRYACRVVQQLLRKCSASQLSGPAEVLLQNALRLSSGCFGSHVIQHLLQFGTEEQRYRLVRVVERNAGTLCRSTGGSGVVAAALEHAAAEDKIWIARAVLQEPELLTCLAGTRQGSAAVVGMLQVLGDRDCASACASLFEDMANLRASEFGNVVVEHLEARAQERA